MYCIHQSAIIPLHLYRKTYTGWYVTCGYAEAHKPFGTVRSGSSGPDQRRSQVDNQT